ncbi:hypothetical protein NEOLEDRAFT_1183253 [Neolentinus lepideus HHB14362 ss-1]|uniref:Uncharacterized protein n=1 Tax=Neolentinus lepideus HHB14362 ss-1 TaxID=1314782 RepID=A0A165NF03_9AGAM|nr:hypothetical protein NEOLEDRAFT_1183253 [Neolentinus lepideus HHB14362 ss-1]
MSTSSSSCKKEETARGRTSIREPSETGILLVKPLKAWNGCKVNIPLSRYIEARVIPCLDGVASWIMETPPLWDPDCEECRRIQRGLYMHANDPIPTGQEGTPLTKNDDLAGVRAPHEDDLGAKSTSVTQPNINLKPSPALEDESKNTIASSCDESG